MSRLSFNPESYFAKKPQMVLYCKSVDIFVVHFGKMYADEEGFWGEVSLHISSPWRFLSPSDKIVAGPLNDTWLMSNFGRKVAESRRKRLKIVDFKMDITGDVQISFEGGYRLQVFPTTMSSEWYRFVNLLPKRPSIHQVFSSRRRPRR